MEIVGLITMFLTFVAEGIAHGFRQKVSRVYYLSFGQKARYNFIWHSANVLFILLLIVSTSLTVIGFLPTSNNTFSLILEVLILLFAMRFCVFSYVNNFAMGVELLYVGNTSTMDKLYRKYIFNIFPPSFIFMAKLFILICLSLYYLNI